MRLCLMRFLSILCLLIFCLSPLASCGGGGGSNDTVQNAVSEVADDAVDIVDRQADTIADEVVDDVTGSVKDAVSQLPGRS